MARKIIWSERARYDKQDILEYWFHRNHSKTYPKKLNELFKKTILSLAQNPNIGKKTDVLNVRIKIVRDYKIFYSSDSVSLNILSILDSRRNPIRIETLS